MANMMLHSKCDEVAQAESWVGQPSQKSLVQLPVTHACRCHHNVANAVHRRESRRAETLRNRQLLKREEVSQKVAAAQVGCYGRGGFTRPLGERLKAGLGTLIHKLSVRHK